MTELNDEQIALINDSRRKRGLPPLTRADVRRAHDSEPGYRSAPQSSDDFIGFLMGYTTGIPIPFTPMAVVGMALHNSQAAAQVPSEPAHTPSPAPDYSPSPSSYDSGGSSYDSGSGSSFDSGSSGSTF